MDYGLIIAEKGRKSVEIKISNSLCESLILYSDCFIKQSEPAA